MKKEETKQINLRVRDGDQVYANEITINTNPTEFVLDFKTITPVLDFASRNALQVKHTTVILAPHHARKLAEILGKVIDDYESKFGKIETPKSLKKAEKLMKKRMGGRSKSDGEDSYIG